MHSSCTLSCTPHALSIVIACCTEIPH
jgi:hypothetical protein